MDITTATPLHLSADKAMTRYAAGADEAFGPLYAAVTPHLTRLLRRLLRNSAQVPDLIQETFLRVHRARRSFRPGERAIPWILTIAQHLFIDMRRARARERFADLDHLDRLSQRRNPAGGAPTGEQLMAAEEVAVRFDRVVDRLPEGQRAALRLVKTEGLSVAAAATALGTTSTGVKLRTHNACRRLRAELGLTCDLAAA
jgi:RNA polymerase sigma-70 factor (ECF subfamily)